MYLIAILANKKKKAENNAFSASLFYKKLGE